MLTFDKELHEYRVDDVVVPSVTQVIAASGLMGDTSHFTPDGAVWGSQIHNMLELHDRGELDLDTLDVAYIPFLNGWCQFLKTIGDCEINAIEQPLSSPLGFAGTIDRVINRYSKRDLLIDVKSGAPNPATGVQLSAYAHLWGKPVDLWAVHLSRDGKFKIVEYKDRNDWSVFQSALNIYAWKKNHGIKE